jgi:hypothetical protein
MLQHVAFVIFLSCIQYYRLIIKNKKIDRRHNRGPNLQKKSIRSDTWKIAQEDEMYHRGWFNEKLRCSKGIIIKEIFFFIIFLKLLYSFFFYNLTNTKKLFLFYREF